MTYDPKRYVHSLAGAPAQRARRTEFGPRPRDRFYNLLLSDLGQTKGIGVRQCLLLLDSRRRLDRR